MNAAPIAKRALLIHNNPYLENHLETNRPPMNMLLNITPAKEVFLPIKKWHNSSRYVNKMAKQLNGRLKMFKAAGKGATWYVPALLGVASVAAAPPEERWRTAFEEGFGVLGGAFGTHLGTLAGLSIVLVLGLGPVGLFVAVFVCASAGGIFGMKAGQSFGDKIYDFSPQFGNGQIYHSPEQLIEVIK